MHTERTDVIYCRSKHSYILYTLSRDKIINLPNDLICRTTSLGYLQYTILAYDKLLHNCEVKTMIHYFLNMAGKRSFIICTL